jgi:hypothetical protein
MTRVGIRTQPLAGILACALTFLFALPAWSASRIDLDPDWLFKADPTESGESAGWKSSIPADTESVALPHTWNVGRLHDFLGVGWYFRRFSMPAVAPGSHIELNFGATFYKARVWLNGVELGAHEGGFTAYSFDISSKLRATNVLAVRIDNRPGIATIPGFAEKGGPQARYDWWTYGGIVRNVWLSTSGSVWIRRQHIRSHPDVGAVAAVVEDTISLGGAAQASGGARLPITVRATALGPDNAVEASETRVVAAPDAGEVTLSLKLSHPKLWSVDTPNVHRMVVELRGKDGRVLDEDSATFGVRTMEIKDRHLLINGERVRLTGMARHEDSPWEGLAETRGTILHDYDDMKSLHTTLSRPVHYPQNPVVLDYADRHGIVLIPEIPIWQFSEAQLANPRVLELAKQQMREMIEEAGNHPSIFGWSVANESEMATPAGIAYFRAIRAMIRELDPQRFVSFADDALPKLERAEQSAANDADFIMMNQYFGSWHGPAAGLGPALDKVNQLFPDKMVIISEMGFAGVFAKDPKEADLARIKTIQEQMPQLAARDWVAGTLLWCYQDYKSPRNLWPGETEGYVDHGLVDQERQRKPSYFVWKSLTSPANITLQWTGPQGREPSGFSLEVRPHTVSELPFYELRDYKLDWRVVDDQGISLAVGEREVADLSEAMRVAGVLTPSVQSKTLRLIVTLTAPTGLVADTETLEWPPAK